jgi:FixJ family two-component response regulator
MDAPASDNGIVAFIDDDESVRVAAGSLLRSVNVRVEVFASGEDFLDFPGIDGVACVVVDVRMPGMSGFELQRRLTAEGRPLPVIFISAHVHRTIVHRAACAGAAFLSKPFSETALLSAVESACGGTVRAAAAQRRS